MTYSPSHSTSQSSLSTVSSSYNQSNSSDCTQSSIRSLPSTVSPQNYHKCCCSSNINNQNFYYQATPINQPYNLEQTTFPFSIIEAIIRLFSRYS